MSEWFADPRSIALMAGAVVQLVITVWQSRQTAALVGELVQWRLEAIETLSNLGTRIEVQEREVQRLRDRKGEH